MATATAAQIKQRILDILDTDSDIRAVSGGTARGMASASLPAFLVFTGDADHMPPTDENYTTQDAQTTRRYVINGLIQTLETGVEFAAESALETYYDKIEALFNVRPGLWLTNNTDTLAGVVNAYLISDTGFTAIELGGTPYAGCQWILEVIVKKDVTRGY